jgi:hypothetical protein
MVIKAESAQPIIDSVPGMEPFDESQLPSRDVVPIAPGDVTPQMMNHAIASPYNQVGGGILEKSANTEQQIDVPVAAQHAAAKAIESVTKGPNAQPLLTEADITRMTTMRGGQRPTQEQIDTINKARTNGLHLS